LNLKFFNKYSFSAILLILLTGSIIYANTFHVPFALDDETSIVQNAVIKNLDNFYANSSGFEFLPNRCVAYFTFALNYHLGGLDVAGYHVFNLVIHLLTALLVYALLRLTFHTPFFQGQSPRSRVPDQKTPYSTLGLQPETFIPLFAALLFVAHPVQTQAVTYIVQRMTSLATLFYLLAVVLYVQSRLSIRESGGRGQETRKETRPAEGRSRIKFGMMMAGSVLAAVVAMMTKPIAFTLPLAILVYEVCFFQGAWPRRLLCLLPILTTLPIVPATILASGHSTGDILADMSEQTLVHGTLPRMDYLFTQFRVLVTYLRLLFLPVNQNVDYDYPVYVTFFTPPVFLSFLLLTGIFALGVYLFWRTRWVGRVGAFQNTNLSPSSSQPAPHATEPAVRLIAFGIFWFFLALSVESSLVPIADLIFEHRLYLPNFGAATAFAAAFCIMARKFTRPAGEKIFLLGAAMLVLGLGFATFQRNHVWGDAIRLWQDVVAKSPKTGRSNNNLGVALEAAGRRPEAVKAFSRAIEVDPGYYKAYYNLADLYLVSGQPDAALPLLQTAIQLNPNFTEAYVELGAALMRDGRFREMTIFLEKNLDRVKGNAEARFYLGAGYAFLGNREAAMRELDIVSRLDPGLAANLAGMLGLNSLRGVSHGRK